MMNSWMDRRLAGVVIGSLGSIGAAAVLVGIRGEIVNANVALVLVLFVLAGGMVGGRGAGMLSAVVAAMSFDFFHTEPYATLKIANGNDVITTLLLLVAGLVIGDVAAGFQRVRDRLRDDRAEITRMHRVAELASKGETVEDLTLIVTAELMASLGLADCRYERPPYVGDFPVLERSGTVRTSYHRFTRDGFELPREGAQIAVVGAGRTVGRFVLIPTPGVGVSPERRLIAIALADQLGAVLAWRPAA